MRVIRNTFFWIAFVLVGLFVSLFLMGSEVIKAEHANSVRRDTVELLAEIGTSVRDAETGQRGFLLSGEEAYLEPYESARKRIVTELARINRLGAKDFSDADLDELQVLIDEKMPNNAHHEKAALILLHLRYGSVYPFLSAHLDSRGRASQVNLIEQHADGALRRLDHF